MNVVIYQSLIIYIFVLFYDVHTISVVIQGSEVGLLSANGTEIECLYTQENVTQIFIVTIMAVNRNSKQFEQIATYIPGQTSTLTVPQGQYLKGRVTLTTITQSSMKAVMTFNQLMCIDATSYQCKVNYLGPSGSQTPVSNKLNVSVQVPPSKPDSVSVVHTPADSSLTSTKHMVHSTSLQSTAVTSTSRETETLSTLQKQNDRTAFNNSTLPTTDRNSSYSTPSNDDVSSHTIYETTTYSSQQTTTAQGIITEGDNITVVCTGDVGKPPAKHVFQKYRIGHILSMTYTATKTSILGFAENCSNYRTSNRTFQVTAKDNNAVIRCVVNSSMADSDMYIDTEPLEVYYEVSMPTIIKYPNKAYYVVGEDTSIHLTCKSDGNPKPNYQWYKENHKERISTNENLNITDMNVTNSGVYICKVSNTFNGGTYTNSTDLQVNIITKADISTTQSSSTGSSSGADDNKKKSDENSDLYKAIAVGVVIFIAFLIVMIAIIAWKKRNSKSPKFKNESNSFVESKPKPVTESRTGDYDYIALEDDATKTLSVNNGLAVEDKREHNKEYLKKQDEEEQEKNESNTSPQPTVYAQVNEATKSRNKQKTETPENADKQEEDTYAETQEGIYDKAGDRRHKENENVEHFDSSSNSSKQTSNGDNKLSIQTSHIGSYANQGFEKDDNRKVATVSPTIRSSSCSQNDEQTNLNRNSQSKKGYENILGTNQTGTSEEDSFHQTTL